MRLSFGTFEVDTERFELREQGRRVGIEPKVFDLIAFFASYPGRVFSHDELVDQVWMGRFVAETTVSTCIKNARKALGDDGSTQRFIKTVRGRGYRFDAEVRRADATPRDAIRPADDGMPALLVLPFRPTVEDARSLQLVEALANDFGSVLSRVPLLRLIVQSGPRDSPAGTSSPRALHERLGIDFVLDGTLHEGPEQYRITARLADAKTGFQLWGELFSIPSPLDTFLQQAVITIIAKLETQLHRAIYQAVRAEGGEPTARQLFLEASSVMAVKGWRNDAFNEAAALLRRSRALEPGFALAHALLALVVGFGDRIGVMTDREQSKAEALDAANRALELDDLDSTVLGYAGCALADIGHIERALPILRNAVELNPANAQAWAALGSVCLLSGLTEEGIRHLSHGIAISPLDSRLSIWGTLLAVGLLQAGRLDEALAEGVLACQRDDRCYLPRIALAAIHLLRRDEAAAARTFADAHRIKPDLSALQIDSVVGTVLGGKLLALSPPASETLTQSVSGPDQRWPA